MNQKVPPNSSMVFDLPLSNRSGWDRLVASCSSEAGAVTGEQDRRSHRRSSLAMVFAVGSAEATSDSTDFGVVGPNARREEERWLTMPHAESRAPFGLSERIRRPYNLAEASLASWPSEDTISP